VEIHRDSPTPETRSTLWLKQRVGLILGVVLGKILRGSRPEGRGSSPFGPTIRTRWNGQDRKKKDDLIDHMVNLFGNTFNKKVVTKLADENLKYTRAQYRDKFQIDLKHERPPMVSEKEWKALIEDAKENLFKKQG
jgi:hypothetical protein